MDCNCKDHKYICFYRFPEWNNPDKKSGKKEAQSIPGPLYKIFIIYYLIYEIEYS